MSNNQKFTDKKQAQRYLLGLRHGKAAERRRYREQREQEELAERCEEHDIEDER